MEFINKYIFSTYLNKFLSINEKILKSISDTLPNDTKNQIIINNILSNMYRYIFNDFYTKKSFKDDTSFWLFIDYIKLKYTDIPTNNILIEQFNNMNVYTTFFIIYWYYIISNMLSKNNNIIFDGNKKNIISNIIWNGKYYFDIIMNITKNKKIKIKSNLKFPDILKIINNKSYTRCPQLVKLVYNNMNNLKYDDNLLSKLDDISQTCDS